MCENIKNIKIVKKSYLQSPYLLFLLSFLDHHLGQQDQELPCSPSLPGIHLCLQGQHQSPDASWGATAVSASSRTPTTAVSLSQTPLSVHLRVVLLTVGNWPTVTVAR